MPRNDLIQLRSDTAANWASVNPILAVGETGFETNTGKFKIGTGSTAWNSLLYATDASDITGTTLSANVTSSSLTSVGTLGSLTVTGDVTVDTNTLKVDSTNNRVGIANASPAYTLDVNGTVEATQFIQGTDYLSPYTAFNNVLINGDLNISQRGAISTASNNGYIFDRWRFFGRGSGFLDSEIVASHLYFYGHPSFEQEGYRFDKYI